MKKKLSSSMVLILLISFACQTNNPEKIGDPFFIYFLTQLPHGPVSIPEVYPEFEKYSNLNQMEKEHAAMVKRLDIDVGRIIQKLNQLEIRENIIIIFSVKLSLKNSN